MATIDRQEVMKACSDKFHPLFQFFYFDSVESLSSEPLEASDFRPLNSRYDAQISAFGSKFQKKLQGAQVFVVGSGALGCEFQKNLALMGVSCNGEGMLTITDDDVIEKSNLSRQLLFRDWNIGQAKSTVAASVNPNFHVEALQNHVGSETENVFHDAFWENLTVVISALDNVNARLCVDQRCLYFQKPLLESGTLGAKCNTRMVIPHLTENYGASRNPPEKQAPKCTVHSLLHNIDHCLTWARSEFEGLLEKKPAEIYIVYMGAIPGIEFSLSAHHASILKEVDGRSPDQYLFSSYTKSFNRFAANLTEQEYQKLAVHGEVGSIFPSRTLQFLTTEWWDFMGFPLNVSLNLTMESDGIIGLHDTIIWLESESFNDHGLGPVPKRWNGTCKSGKNFTLDRKIVGVHNFYESEDSGREYTGHGSHTASTPGTVQGGVPLVRIAVYKVCSFAECSEQDVLAAFDDAIADEVDILSVSIGGRFPIPWQYDGIAIGSFHAALKGILTVNAAGDNSFDPGQTATCLLFSMQLGKEMLWLVPTQDAVYECTEVVFLELHAAAMLCLPSGDWMAPGLNECTDPGYT